MCVPATKEKIPGRTNKNHAHPTPFITLELKQAVVLLKEIVPTRVSSKWKKKCFGSNRNKPKQDLFRVCFGLFRETKICFFRFVSVFRTYIETTETNRTVSKRTETIQNVLKNLSYILPRVLCLSYSSLLSYIYLGSSVCHIPVIFLSYYSLPVVLS